MPSEFYRRTKKNRPTRKSNLEIASEYLKIAGNFSAIAIAIGAVLYGLGFIIVNTYTYNIGLVDYNFLKPSYLITGFVTIIYFGVPIVIIIIGKKQQHSRITDLVFVSLFLLLFGWIFLFSNPHKSLVMILAYFAISIVIWNFAFRDWIHKNWESTRKDANRTFGIMTLVGFIVLFFGYSIFLYPSISFSYGGGSPRPAQIIIKEDTPHYIFTEMGIDMRIPVKSSTESGPCRPEAERSDAG